VVFAVNSLLYLNQSVPPFGVSLNSLTNGTTAFPMSKCFWGFSIKFMITTVIDEFSL